MPKLNITLAQMHIVLGNTQKNIEAMEKTAAEAARRGSHLLVLPELWSTGYALEQANELASTLNTGLLAHVSSVAVGNKISVVGSLLEKRGVTVANSAPFFAPNGKMMGIYRKLHLFGLMEEDKYLDPGEAPLWMDLPWGRTALAICYDLRFPELFRRYALDDVVMTIIPAEWPLERVEHWRSLLIARAIENQMYVVAANAAGQIGDTVFAGHSMIVDPWGKVVVEAGEDPMLLTAEIDLDLVDTTRKRIPVFQDRRPEVY